RKKKTDVHGVVEFEDILNIDTHVTRHIHTNFINWSSDNMLIDSILQTSQSECKTPENIVEWQKGGFGSIYSATWIDGWIIDWNEDDSIFVRSGPKKAIHHIMFSFQGSRGFQCYGITKFPETGNLCWS
ncbi:4657_t:CDS:2, partial [Dentiscutata heterogama]